MNTSSNVMGSASANSGRCASSTGRVASAVPRTKRLTSLPRCFLSSMVSPVASQLTGWS